MPILIPTVPGCLAAADPTVPLLTGMVAFFMFIGLAIFVRIRKRWMDFKQAVEAHGFAAPGQLPRFVRNWRTLATGPAGTRAMEIREQEVPNSESSTHFQELTIRPRATGGLEFLFRPTDRWKKLEPEGEARRVEIGDPEFDREWFIETNQPQLLRTVLTPELCAHFTTLRRHPGTVSVSLKNCLITIRDRHRLLPAERFTDALKLAHILATIAEECEKSASPIP